jgi:hypothetical protein
VFVTQDASVSIAQKPRQRSPPVEKRAIAQILTISWISSKVIRRADLVAPGEAGKDVPALSIPRLERKGFLYPALRKPDFQPEIVIKEIS